MKTVLLLFVCIYLSTILQAQTGSPQAFADFSTERQADGAIRFVPNCPPLPPAPAGASKAAFYTYFWEFGDGDFSFESSPLHRYGSNGTYQASLDATAHYDDNKKPPKRGVRTMLADAGGTAATLAQVFEHPRQRIALKTNRKPRPEEELVCIVSYRNNSAFATDGRLHLFFNEKKFPASHFTFQDARTHFGETPDAAYSALALPKTYDWAALFEGIATSGCATGPRMPAPPSPRTEIMLEKARKAYREEKVWRFTQLQSGESRNMFATLGGTASMLKDTSAFIHLYGLFEPFDPAIPADEFTLEIEIVSSHDPNAIAVSDTRVNYRRLGSERLDYKVQFQNNGEGPAQKVELTITVPEGLNTARMRPLSWYPECPICPKDAPPAGSCLDTATRANGLVFTFRNIYLPGSRQEGVSDYDSTQGFVRYRLEPGRDMPKRAFRSRAKIVFDKNPPIYTNFSKTRFKPGISPGLKAGYAFRPDSSGSGYLFMGASLSPYKSWKIYPQVELLTGLKGRTDLPETTTEEHLGQPIPGVDFYKDTVITTTRSGNRGFISVEIPVLLRKNFTKFFGAGIGGSAILAFHSGTDYEKRTIDLVPYIYEPMLEQYVAGDPMRLDESEQERTSFSETTLRYSVFADLTFGAVRAGPNLGIRAGGFLHEGFQPFVQISFEVKL
ncbi:MAG: PKD domain-containing protein [Lewinellaceae bacterium]|nr:PKD domain-containing protein [Lewinellaceae bacterium]